MTKMTNLRRTPRAAALALALGLLLAPCAAAQQTGADAGTLTLDEAIGTAVANSPTYLATVNDETVSRADLRAARMDFIPTATLSNSYSYQEEGRQRFGSTAFSSQPALYASSYGLNVSLGLSVAKLLQPSVSRAQLNATERRIEGVEANLVSNVKQLYLSTLQAQEQVAQAQREVDRTAEYVRLAQAKLEVGAGTPLDVRRAEVQLGQAEVGLVEAQNSVQTLRMQLGQEMGVVLDPETRLTSEFAVFDPEWQVDQLVDAALQHNPTLRAASASYDAAETLVTSARSAYLPTLSLSFGVNGYNSRAANLDEPFRFEMATAGQQFENCLLNQELLGLIGQTTECRDPSTAVFQDSLRNAIASDADGFPFGYERQPWSASIGISVPIYPGPQRSQQITQARVAREDARLQVREQELRLRTDVATALLNLRNYYRTVELQDQVVERASEELRLAQERFRFGASSSIEVVDAQTNLAEAEQARIAAVYNFHKSLAALEALVGQPLR